MIPNNNLSILPFYDSLAKQNHNKPYAYGTWYPLITPVDRIPTFQIIRPASVTAVTSVKLKSFNPEGIVDMNITAAMATTGLSVVVYDDYSVIKYPSNDVGAWGLDEGLYYLEIVDSSGTVYSDLFTMSETIEDCILLEYGNVESIFTNDGIIDFDDDFKFRMYIRSDIGKPDYNFEEQVTDLDGYKFTEKQVSEKKYIFNFLAPEYVCDALRIVRMSDNITITDKNGAYTVDTFLMTPKWQDDGYLAAVEVEFECDTIVKKINARYSNVDEDILPVSTKMYIGLINVPTPTEVDITTQMEERVAAKVDQQFQYIPTVGKYSCFAYPAEYGTLVNAYVFAGWSIFSGFNLTQLTFTFGTNEVLMNVYTYKYPVTYAIPIQIYMHYNFLT